MTPFGPWAPDQPVFGRDGVAVALNVLPGAVGYNPIASLEARSTGTITGGVQYIEPNPFAVRQIAIERSRVFISARPAAGGFHRFYDAVSGVDISNTAHTNIRAGEFARIGDTILACDVGMPLQQMPLGGNVLVNVPNAPRSRVMGVIGNFVVLGHIFNPITQVNDYRRIIWSGFGDITQWTPGTNQCDSRAMSQPVQAIIGGETEGLVFLSDRIMRMEYIGDIDGGLIFGFEKLFGIGVDARSSIVEFDDRLFFVADGNFWQIYARTSLSQISDEQVSRFYRRTSNADDRANVSAAIDYRNKLVCWIYGGTRTQVNNMLIYDLKTEQWSLAQVPGAYRLTQFITATAGNRDVGTTEVVGGISLTNNDIRLLGAVDPSGRVHTFTGPPLAARIETTDQGGPERTHIAAIRPYVNGAVDTTVVCKLGVRNSLTDPTEYTEPKTVDPETGNAYFGTDARYWRARFEISGNFLHAIGFDADVKPSGMR